jgi:hypothetical protein
MNWFRNSKLQRVTEGFTCADQGQTIATRNSKKCKLKKGSAENIRLLKKCQKKFNTWLTVVSSCRHGKSNTSENG